MSRRVIISVITGFCALFFVQGYSQLLQAANSKQVIKLGVLTFRPKLLAEVKWMPLVQYLNRTLKDGRVVLRALNYDEMEVAVAEKKLDIVLIQQDFYVQMSYRNALTAPIATLLYLDHDSSALNAYGGVIAVLAERDDLRRLADLKGLRVGVASKLVLGGYLMQAHEMHKAGVPLPENSSLVEVGMPPSRAIKALLAGMVDVVYVRSGIIEALEKEGLIGKGQLRIINARKVAGFPFALSTDLYPEWPIATLPHLDEMAAIDIAAALLQMPHNGKEAEQIGMHGFIVPANYHRVADMLRALRQPPFDAGPAFFVADIWNKYQWQISIGGMFLAVIFMLLILLIRFNRRSNVLRKRAEIGDTLLKNLSEHVPGMIYQYRRMPDGSSHYPYASKGAHDLFSLNPCDMKEDAKYLFERVHPDDIDAYRERIDESARTMTPWKAEYRVLLPDGGIYWREGLATPSREMDDSILWQGFATDITDRKRMEAELRTQASTDMLTGLPNRRSFFNIAEAALARIKRGKENPAVLVMLDLDRFKSINDNYGHGVGDLVLQQLGTLMLSTLRRGDYSGRIGGEEFVLLLPETSIEQAQHLADRLRRRIAGSVVEVEGARFSYTASFGLTAMVDTDSSIDESLARADDAMYRAKQKGRNCVEVA